MKKITLWLFALFTCWQISAQTGTVVVGVNDGTPNTSTGVPSPLQDYYKTQRMQILYTAAELSGAGLVAGNITEIGWVATALNASTLQENYTISMKSTASTVLTGTFETGATVVYGPADFTPSTTGNVMFTLSTPFTWDGTSNVIIELCAGLATGAFTENVSCANSTTSGIQTVYYRNDSATAPCTQATGTTSNQRPLLVATGNVASCLAPLNIVFNNVTSSTADISWDPVSPVPGIGYEYVVSTSNVAPTGAGTATIPVFASLTGLNPQTTYYIFVRSNCSAGVFSGWNGPVSFTTGCAPITTFPSLEPFATFLPNQCWSEGDGGDLTAGPATFGSSGWQADGLGNVGTTGAFNYNVFDDSANDWVISPEFTIPATGYELKFDAAAANYDETTPVTNWESDDFVEVLVSSTGTANWTVLYTYNDSNVPSSSGAANVIDLDAYNGQTVRFAYRAVEGAADGDADIDFSIDNFQVRLSPTCPDQTGLTVGTITDTTADFSWDNLGTLGYEYAVTTSATPPASGTSTTNTFYIATGLAPQTLYYIHVRPMCSPGVYGNWASISFTTNCTSVTSFVENFDAVTTPAFPNCWAKVGAGGTTNTQTGSANSAPNTVYFASFSTTSLAVVSTQQVSNLGAGTNRIKFDMRANFTVGGVVEFGYLTDPADATTFVPLTTFTASALTYSTYQFSPPAGSYSDYPAFRHTGNPGNSVLIDNVVWEANPACADQTGVVFSNLTTTSADTSWDPIIGVAGYEYAVNTSATPPVSGTSTTATIYAATGLTPETLYYIHVRPMCSPGVYGAWASISFYTGYCLPSSTSADSYVNNFSTTGGSQNISNLATGFTAGGYLNANSQFVESYETSSFNFNAEIVGGTAGFSIWIDWNNDLVLDNATEKVYNTTSYGNGPFSGTIAIPAGTAIGNYRMRITTDRNASNPSNPCAAVTRAEFEDYTISVIAPPACLPSSASVSSVTDVAANLNWTAIPSALVGYEYVLDNVATNPAGSGTATTAITYSASGLTPSTVYYFHIRSVCSVGTYSAWSTISFTTSCASVNVPYTENFETATVPNLPMCTSQQNVGTGNLWTVAANLGYGFTTNALIYSYNSTNAANVWFYTNGINLTGGTNYKITYDYGAASVTFPEKLKVAYGTSALASAMTTVLADHTNVVNTTPLNSVVNFTPTVSGVYYFGFNANSIADQLYLLVDNISVDVVLSNDSFNNKSNVMAYPNPVKDVLNLSYKTAISNVRVINLLGQEVLNTKTNTNDVQVDMSALNAGAYIVNITVEDTVHTIKVIKE